MNNPYQAPSNEEWVQQVQGQNSFFDQVKGKKSLKKLAELKVNSPKNLKELVNIYYWSTIENHHNGLSVHDTVFRPTFDAIVGADFFTNTPDPKQNIELTANILKLMKSVAVGHKMNDVADAVTQSSYWFWKNIEEPQNPQASLASYGTNENEPAVEKAKKRATRAKFIQWGVIGTSLLVGGTMFYFAFFKQPKQAKKSNPRRISSGVGKVTKGRVRKRNRKAPVKAGLPKRNPVVPRTSSLAQYRKKFEQEKRQKARKANPKRKTTVRKSKGLRLKK